MNTVYYRCPVGGVCVHTEAFDPAHETDDPAVPASGDEAHDRLVEHVVGTHKVPRDEVGRLVSAARVVTQKPVPHLFQLRAMWAAGESR